MTRQPTRAGATRARTASDIASDIAAEMEAEAEAMNAAAEMEAEVEAMNAAAEAEAAEFEAAAVEADPYAPLPESTRAEMAAGQAALAARARSIVE